LAVFFEPNTKPDALKAEREFSAKSRVTLSRHSCGVAAN
jgi:hypothetical protein